MLKFYMIYSYLDIASLFQEQISVLPVHIFSLTIMTYLKMLTGNLLIQSNIQLDCLLPLSN